MVLLEAISACFFHLPNTQVSQPVSLSKVCLNLILDLRIQLSASGYGETFKDDSLVTVSAISDKLLQTYVNQFKFLKENSTGTLTQLLDLIMHGHMIDNVVLVLGGALRNKDADEVVKSCHPLGRFEVLVSSYLI